MNYINGAESLPEFFQFLWFDFKNLFPYYIARPITSYREWKYVRRFPPGTLIETCSYHPAIIVKIDRDGHITHYDLIKSCFGGCSLFHCGIVKIDMKKAMGMCEAHKTGGSEELYKFLDLKVEEEN